MEEDEEVVEAEQEEEVEEMEEEEVVVVVEEAVEAEVEDVAAVALHVGRCCLGSFAWSSTLGSGARAGRRRKQPSAKTAILLAPPRHPY